MLECADRLIASLLAFSLVLPSFPADAFPNPGPRSGLTFPLEAEAFSLPLVGAHRSVENKGPFGFLHLTIDLPKPAEIALPIESPELDEIKAVIKKQNPGADLSVVNWAYAQASARYGHQAFAGSQELFLTHASRLALSTAHLQASPVAVAAALLHMLSPQEIGDIPLGDHVSDEDSTIIRGLVGILDEYQKIPFRPPVDLGHEDTTLETLLDLQKRWIEDEAAALLGDPQSPDLYKTCALIFSLIIADDLQTMATLTPASSEALRQKVRWRVLLLDAPQCMRLGWLPVAQRLQDEEFRVFQPEKRQAVKNEMHAALKISPEQAKKLLDDLVTSMNRMLAALSVKKAYVRGDVSRYLNAHVENERRKDQQRAAQQPVTAAIAHQTRLLRLKVVVQNNEDFKRIQNLYLVLGPEGRKPYDWQKLPHLWKDLGYAYALSTIECMVDGKRVTVEINIFTEAADRDRETLMRGENYIELFSQTYLKKAAVRYAMETLGPQKKSWILRFIREEKQPRTTGDLQTLLEANWPLAPTPDVYVLIPTDRWGNPFNAKKLPPDTDLDDVFWAAITLPAHATGADLAFHTRFNRAKNFYSPRTYPGLREVHFEPRMERNQEQVSLYVPRGREKVIGLADRLPSTAIILPGPETMLDDESQREKVHASAQSPRARLMTVDPLSLKPSQTDRSRKTRIEVGTDQLKALFGFSSEWNFLSWAGGFATFNELLEAIGQEGIAIAEKLAPVFYTRFVKISQTVQVSPDGTVATLTMDPFQPNLIGRVINSLRRQGWTFSYDISALLVEGKMMTLQLKDLHPPPKSSKPFEDALAAALRADPMERLYLPWRPKRQSRLVRSVMDPDPAHVADAVRRLADQNVDVTCIRYLGLTNGLAEYEWELAGPDKASDSPSTNLPQAISDALSWKGELPKNLIHLHFDPLVPLSHDHRYRLTFTNDEVQLGVLKDVTGILSGLGWDVKEFRQREDGRGRKTWMEIRRANGVPATPEEQTRLLEELKTLWRVRGERQPVSGGQYFSMFFGIEDRPGSLHQITAALAHLGISIDSGNLSESSDGISWIDLVLYVPPSETPETLKEKLRKAQEDGQLSPLPFPPDINRRNFSKATAKYINGLNAQDFKSIPGTAPRQFIEFPKKLEPPTLTENSNANDVWEATIDWNYVALYRSARELNFIYTGFYPDDNTIPMNPLRAAALQFRKGSLSGLKDTPYAIHPIEVENGYMNEDSGLDELFTLVAVLHDVLEDGPKNVYNFYTKKIASEDTRVEALTQLEERFHLGIPGDTTSLSAYEQSILNAAREEIIQEIRTRFPNHQNRLIYYLKRYDHSQSSFEKSLEELFDMDVPDGMIVKARDQGVNLKTAYLVPRHLEKTLMKNIRTVFPRLIHDRSRMTDTYWLGRTNLLKTMITESLRLPAESAGLEILNTLYDKEKRDLTPRDRFDIMQDVLLGIDDILVWIRQHRGLLVEAQTPEPAIDRFADILREMFQILASRIYTMLTDDSVAGTTSVPDTFRDRQPELHLPLAASEPLKIALMGRGFLANAAMAYVDSKNEIHIHPEAPDLLQSIVNPIRSQKGLAELSKEEIRSEVEEHERQHVVYRSASPEQRQALKAALGNIDDVIRQFGALYGNHFIEDTSGDLAQEELWVLVHSPDLLGNGRVSIAGHDQKPMPLPAPIYKTLRDFSMIGLPASWTSINESTAHEILKFISSENLRVPISMVIQEPFKFDVPNILAASSAPVDWQAVEAFKRAWNLACDVHGGLYNEDPAHVGDTAYQQRRTLAPFMHGVAKICWTAITEGKERDLKTLMVLPMHEMLETNNSDPDAQGYWTEELTSAFGPLTESLLSEIQGLTRQPNEPIFKYSERIWKNGSPVARHVQLAKNLVYLRSPGGFNRQGIDSPNFYRRLVKGLKLALIEPSNNAMAVLFFKSLFSEMSRIQAMDIYSKDPSRNTSFEMAQLLPHLSDAIDWLEYSGPQHGFNPNEITGVVTLLKQAALHLKTMEASPQIKSPKRAVPTVSKPERKPPALLSDATLAKMREIISLGDRPSSEGWSSVETMTLDDQVDARYVEAFKALWQISQQDPTSDSADKARRLTEMILNESGLRSEAVVLLSPVFFLLSDSHSADTAWATVDTALTHAGYSGTELQALNASWNALLPSENFIYKKLSAAGKAFFLCTMATTLAVWSSSPDAALDPMTWSMILFDGLSSVVDRSGQDVAFYFSSREIFLNRFFDAIQNRKSVRMMLGHFGFLTPGDDQQRSREVARYHALVAHLEIWLNFMHQSVGKLLPTAAGALKELWRWEEAAALNHALLLNQRQPTADVFWKNVYRRVVEKGFAIVVWLPLGKETPEQEAKTYLGSRVELKVYTDQNPAFIPPVTSARRQVILVPVSRSKLLKMGAQLSEDSPPLIWTAPESSLVLTANGQTGLSLLELKVLNLFLEGRPLSFILNWTEELQSIRNLRDIETFQSIITFLSSFGLLKLDKNNLIHSPTGVDRTRASA